MLQEEKTACTHPQNMHWQKSSTSDQQQQPRPYQGVRVKEPVKELLKRKRGHCNNTALTTTTVVLPHATLSPYTPTGYPGVLETDGIISSVPTMIDESFCTSWLSQPSPAALQPLSQWTTCSDYIPHESLNSPYTADMYVQPVCPSYTVVGPSSVLTYTSQPLFTNFGARSPNSAVMPQMEITEQQCPVSYFPWAQPLSAIPASSLQYQSSPTSLPGTQFVPLPIAIPEPALQDVEDARRSVGSIAIEKLLEGDEDHDTYVLNHTLSIDGF